jgi:hypothetical protein
LDLIASSKNCLEVDGRDKLLLGNWDSELLILYREEFDLEVVGSG